MPVDPEVLIGGLPNGLRFYIRPNPRPARQAELRLVVKAGSVLEDDDQRGLAHFVEHMQFQGSRHFPGQSIDSFLASLGLSIGEDANAETSFDDTQYTLRVPTDRPGVLDMALTVLEDWAGGALFEPAAIERQRAIVLAEWRRNLGAERTHRRQDAARAARGIALRRPVADRRPGGDPDRAARTAGAVLSRLVPARSDGGDRRRRRRPERRRRDDPAALLVARQSGAGAAAADLRRAGASRHALRHRHRQGEHQHRREPQQPAAGAQSGIGRRLSRHPEGSAVRADARRSARRARAGRPAAVPAAPPPAAACFRRRRRATKRRCRRWCRTTASRAASTRS